MKYNVYNLLPSYGTNTYLVWDDASKEAMLVDPADKSEKLLNEIMQMGLNVKYVINTHGHGDHIGGNNFFKTELNAKLAIHQDDAEMLIDSAKNLSAYMGSNIVTTAADMKLNDGDVLTIGVNEVKIIATPGHSKGGICLYFDKTLISGDVLTIGVNEVKIIATPGHSKGGICLYFDKTLISGDTLFAQSVGRSDLPGGDHNTLVKSIKEKLFILPEDTLVLPGHGAETTIEDEQVANPFVGFAANV